jgi:hypothetical protein
MPGSSSTYAPLRRFMAMTYIRSSIPMFSTRICVSAPTMAMNARTTIANVMKASEKFVACPTSARLTRLAETRVRKMLIRERTSF